MRGQLDTLTQILAAFPDEQAAVDHFTAVRWKSGSFCPYCGCARVYHFADRRNHKCGACRKRFSIKVGTVFEDTKIPLRTWMLAICMITSHKEGIASAKLAEDLGVAQKTAWFLTQRLRRALRWQLRLQPTDRVAYQKIEKPLAIDVPFDDALARFINIDPKEIRDVDEDENDGFQPGSELELPRATHQGQMAIGDLLLDCYVLEDGRRVFHKRGMARALGLKSEGGNAFMKTMQGKGLGSGLPAKLQEKINNPINFKPLTQDLAHGYEADVLAEVARAIADADREGKLSNQQRRLAAQAQILLGAFAKIGVVALIDEATGYQQIRDPKALRILVQQYIEDEKREWEKQFPDSYYDELNRIYGSKSLTKRSNGVIVQNRPQHFGGFTRTYVYHPLENGAVLEELDRLNPKINSKGTRRARFHQHLTEGYGIEKLKRQVQEVQTLLAVSDNVGQFKKLFMKRFPQKGDQDDLLDD